MDIRLNDKVHFVGYDGLMRKYYAMSDKVIAITDWHNGKRTYLLSSSTETQRSAAEFYSSKEDAMKVATTLNRILVKAEEL